MVCLPGLRPSSGTWLRNHWPKFVHVTQRFPQRGENTHLCENLYSGTNCSRVHNGSRCDGHVQNVVPLRNAAFFLLEKRNVCRARMWFSAVEVSGAHWHPCRWGCAIPSTALLLWKSLTSTEYRTPSRQPQAQDSEVQGHLQRHSESQATGLHEMLPQKPKTKPSRTTAW